MDDSEHLPQPIYTPPLSRVPSYIQFAPKRALNMASFDNLVALANYEERLREARKIVWRDRGERPTELKTLWECLEHGARGGLRGGALAFAIRSGVNFVLLMAKIKNAPRSYRFALIRQALFGADSLRFAAMLGMFVSIYKTVLNSLPLLLPGPNPSRRAPSKQTRQRSKLRPDHPLLPTSSLDSPFHDDEEEEEDVAPLRGRVVSNRRARLSLSAQAHQMWVRKKTRRWYSVIAGALAGGIAILCEKRGRRVGIAQQMFVRGLQGTYNAISEKRGFKVPHGDVLVFAFCCAQIMYAFLMKPDTLPKSYTHWIQEASKVPVEGVSMNRDLVRDRVFKLSDVDAALRRTGITAAHRADLLTRRALALAPEPSFGPYFGPCSAVHPWEDVCWLVPVERFFTVFKWMVPIYGALHLIPMLLFKRKTVFKNPSQMLMRAGWGTARSSAFLSMFVVIYQSFFCFKHNLWLRLTALRSATSGDALAKLVRQLLPQRLIDVLLSKPSFYLGGMLCGLSLFVEEARRRPELAMYVLPKGLESMWVMARGKGLVFRTGQWGEVLFTAAAMSMVMSTYQNDPEHLSSFVRRILYQFIGPN